ncbi:MAG TPA: OsmC family protein [Rubrobacteraceae bacterium]|jgi:putative redox protein|nr:OsmC family protein [Rubrobacteraceae bacterium]
MSEQTRSTTNGSGAAGPREVLVYGDAKGFTQEIIAGPHQLTADEPKGVGGNDEGPTPYDLLLAALGSCTSITVTMYAQRKGWPLQGVRTWLRHSRIHAQDCAECETKEGKLDHIELEIRLEGPLLSEEQRTKLLEIAEKCPVHRTLVTENVISTRAT